MEEKKQVKISMSGFFLILAIIVIAVMGYFIYKISTEKTEKENQIASLNNEISSLQSSSKDLQGKLDSIANRYLNKWTIDRLGNTDQAILRMGIYELLYTDTPDIVVINEAVELAKKYSDDDVKSMINGVLDKVYHEKVDHE